jgi:hypothetical protein
MIFSKQTISLAFCSGMLFAIAGCAGNYPQATGPLNISSSVEEGLRDRVTKKSNGVVAVALDGRNYGTSNCAGVQCSDGELSTALSSCRRKSQGSECVIYAQGGKYIWNNED